MPNDSRRNHIAVFLPSLRGGGAERAMVTLVNGFAERGNRVDLVLSSAEGPYLAEVANNVRIVDLGASRVLKSLLPLVRYLRRERPNTLLSALNYANIIAILARKLARVKLRLVVSERANFSVSKANSSLLRGWLMETLMAHLYPKADGVVAVSEGVAEDLAYRLCLKRSSIGVVYNPVVTEFLLAQSKKSPQHPWLLQGEPPVILGVGRLVKQKDFVTLLRAFSIVCRERDVRLIILGEGELRQELTDLVAQLGLQQKVDLPGFVTNPMAYMSHSTLFVLSSAWEGLPNALIQAMACGTQVVSTDCPSGPKEILEDGRWGMLTPVGDIDSLAHAIETALNETDHRNVVARGAEFSVDRAVDGYLNHILPSSNEL